MIPENFVEQWRTKAPWQMLSMVEQDLVISRALIELYNEPAIRDSLTFRGGTALNKLHLNVAARYSEDIDFVQMRPEPIGHTLNGIRKVLDPWLGEPKRKLTERSAKLIYYYVAVDNTPAKLKIEINTKEHFQVLPLSYINLKVNNEWFNGEAIIHSYDINELIATKLRALYQRRKGRDLFDLWLVLNKKLVNVNDVISIFNKYCEFNSITINRLMFENNLNEKLKHNDFTSDINALLHLDQNWDINTALKLVHSELIMRINI